MSLFPGPVRAFRGSGELRPADRRLAISVARGSQGHRADVHAGEAGDRGVAPAYRARPSGEARPLFGCTQTKERANLPCEKYNEAAVFGFFLCRSAVCDHSCASSSFSQHAVETPTFPIVLPT